MLRHIVMWKVKDGVEGRTKEESAVLLKENFEALKGKVEVLVDIQMGINAIDDPDSKDLVLVADVKDEEDLTAYKIHPDHQAAVKFASTMLYERVVIDYFY